MTASRRIYFGDQVSFWGLYAGVTRSCFRFEGRQSYGSPFDDPMVSAYFDGDRSPIPPGPLQDQIRLYPRGTFRRVRLVTEPWTQYTEWEMHAYPTTIQAGEEVRVIRADHPDAKNLLNADWLEIDGVVWRMVYTEIGELRYVELADAEIATEYQRLCETIWASSEPFDVYMSQVSHRAGS